MDELLEGRSVTLPRLSTAAQVAEVLGVKEHRVYDLVRQDLIPHVKMGRQVRFNATTIERWLAEGGTSLSGGWRKEAAVEQ